MPFRGELVTWADNHAEAVKALRQQVLEAIEASGKQPVPEISNLLDQINRESYALGMVHAALIEGRYQ